MKGEFRVLNASRGNYDYAMAGKARTNGKIDVCSQKRGILVEARQISEYIQPNHGRGGADCQNVIQVIELPLIELFIDRRERCAAWRQGQTELSDDSRLLPANEFRAGKGNRRRCFDRGEHRGQCVGIWGAVIVQQP